MRNAVIIKYRIDFAGLSGHGWGKATRPDQEELIDLKEKEALEQIKRYGLEPFYKDDSVTVYDTPDGAFYNEHKGFFSRTEGQALSLI